MRKLLPSKKVVACHLEKLPKNHRGWSWKAELECGHQTRLQIKWKQPLSSARRQELYYGRPYQAKYTWVDYEDGVERTGVETKYKPVPDEEVLVELRLPPGSTGCRKCPRVGPGAPNVLFRLAHAHHLASRCGKHGLPMCATCGEPTT